MHFRVEVPFQIESTAKFDVSNKNTYFKGFHKFTLINFSCSFHLPFINTVFDDSILKITFCSEQTIVWSKIIVDYFGLLTEKIEKAMKLVSI